MKAGIHTAHFQMTNQSNLTFSVIKGETQPAMKQEPNLAAVSRTTEELSLLPIDYRRELEEIRYLN